MTIIQLILSFLVSLLTMKCYQSYRILSPSKRYWGLRSFVRELSNNGISESVPAEVTINSKQDFQYKLLDHGNFQRLEKFGNYLVVRPSKTSRFKQQIDPEKWGRADFRYVTDTRTNTSRWENIEEKDFSDWIVQFNHMKFKLSAYDGGQVGVFPEQLKQWGWLGTTIQNHLTRLENNKQNQTINILNAFSYTGGSTLACLVHPNVLVTNLDSSKASTQAAKDNFALSTVQGKVRWIVDDCQTFINREIRRVQESDNYYHGLIFDPPAFGRSKDKRTWQINRDLPILIDSIPQLLSKKNPLFILITCHDPSWPEEKLENYLFNVLKNAGIHGFFERGRLRINSNVKGKGNRLDLGSYVRWSRYPAEKIELNNNEDQ